MRLEPYRLIFIDETAVTTKMTRLRGRSLRGARLKVDAPFGHWRTRTFIAGLRVDELAWVIPLETKGMRKWNFLGKISEEIFDEERTI